MADTTYLDLLGLQEYDKKIKEKIATDDAATLASAEGKVTQLADGQVKTNTDAIAKLNGLETETGSVAKAVKDAKDAKDAVEAEIGTLENLTTQNKADLVVALNEVAASVEAGGTGSVVKISTETTTEGYAKSYTFTQGSKNLGVIDIPKDMVVSSGTVETNPVGQEAGTYLVLTLANATNDKVYINVGKLVDIYKAAESATQIQIAIDPATREISATIVAGSITATELASDSIVTTKIADGNVTKTKLSVDVQTSLGKADTAIQESDLTALKADVAANKTSLAEGGATDTAIKAAKKAGDDAQADVDALETRVGALEADTFTAITTEQIDALFTSGD